MKYPTAVAQFEEALREYTGAKFAVATQRCLSALTLCCLYLKVREVTIPDRIYNGVYNAMVSIGVHVHLERRYWVGSFDLHPYPIWDCAHKFEKGMYIPGQFQCLSFGGGKILSVGGAGGAILHDDPAADSFFRRRRFDGRTEGIPPHLDDDIVIAPTNGPLFPAEAARLHTQLWYLNQKTNDRPIANYPDLTRLMNSTSLEPTTSFYIDKLKTSSGP